MSSLREEIMKTLGSSINFKGLADEWYIKHTEDTDAILATLQTAVLAAAPKQKKAEIKTSKVFQEIYKIKAIPDTHAHGYNQALNDYTEALQQLFESEG